MQSSTSHLQPPAPPSPVSDAAALCEVQPPLLLVAPLRRRLIVVTVDAQLQLSIKTRRAAEEFVSSGGRFPNGRPGGTPLLPSLPIPPMRLLSFQPLERFSFLPTVPFILQLRPFLLPQHESVGKSSLHL